MHPLDSGPELDDGGGRCGSPLGLAVPEKLFGFGNEGRPSRHYQPLSEVECRPRLLQAKRPPRSTSHYCLIPALSTRLLLPPGEDSG
jgi:hypothetical protein